MAWLLLALVAGALAYALLVLVACGAAFPGRRRASARRPISILKPLAGLDEGLEDNLASFFALDYPCFELLFAVRHAGDPAVAVVERLRARFPHVPATLVLTGEPPYPNAKVYSLERMLAVAHHDLLVMADSDIRVTPGTLHAVAAEFDDERLGLATCPYRAVGGADPWSTLEALGMNTAFISGVLVARMLEGMRFGVGPTMVARRQAIDDIGGFGRLKSYLAEDFMMGRLIAEAGWHVSLSACVVEHRLGTQRWRSNFAHRLRWGRSTRRSRPAGYVGQLFTYPLPFALALVAVRPAWWPLPALLLAVHAAGVWATAHRLLGDPLPPRRWWLVAVEDLLSFGFWIAGFFGNSVSWRGRRYYLKRDGTFVPEPFKTDIAPR